MADIVTSTFRKTKLKKQTNNQNQTITISQPSPRRHPTMQRKGTCLCSRTETLYAKAFRDKQLSVFLEKPKTLRLSQESVPSSFGNYSLPFDMELEVTVISSSQRAESFLKSTGNTQPVSPVRSKHEEEKPSTYTVAVNLQVQDATVEGNEVGGTPSNIPIKRSDCDPKEAKEDHKLSVKFCKKFIDHDPSRGRGKRL